MRKKGTETRPPVYTVGGYPMGGSEATAKA